MTEPEPICPVCGAPAPQTDLVERARAAGAI